MAVFKIGRLELDHAAPHSWNGRTLTIPGELVATTLAGLVAKRQAAIGLADNPHEPIVPVTYTEDPSLDGYYRVDSVSVATVPASLTTFWLPVDITLELVSFSPVHESRHRGAVRTNDHAITSAAIRTWHAIPAAYAGYFETFSNRDDQTRETATGNVKVWFGGTGVGRDHYLDAVHGYHVAPADHYDGAAEVRVDDVAQVGEWATNSPADWEITNGIIGLRMDPNATAGRLNLRLYDPDTNGYASSSSSRLFVLGHYSGATFYPFTVDPHTFTVIRNRPELVQARLTFTGPVVGGIADEFAYSLDILLRRGANYVELYLDGLGTSAKWGIQRDSAEGCTALTGGVEATANDAEGNRYLILTPADFTALTSGLYVDVTAAGMPAALGYAIGGSGAVDLDTSQNTAYAYHAAHYERTRIVGR